MTIFIGLGHYSRVGKDTFATLLQEEFAKANVSIERRSFAGVLKECCHLMFRWAGVREAAFYDRYPQMRDEIIPELGMTVVELWIRFGTPCVRQMLHPDTWIRTTLYGSDKRVVIITDTRFPNEAAAIKEKNGRLYRVLRDGIGPRPGSEADAALLGYCGWDDDIHNHGDLSALRREAKRIALDIAIELL